MTTLSHVLDLLCTAVISEAGKRGGFSSAVPLALEARKLLEGDCRVASAAILAASRDTAGEYEGEACVLCGRTVEGPRRRADERSTTNPATILPRQEDKQ